jgi:hypothetical protein
MSELGFTVNSAKSFFDEPDPDTPSHTFFRESCGGDYKGGVDVRPYMPECDLQEERYVESNEYVAWIHRLINGILNRWDVSEIPLTLGFLLRSISNSKGKISFVPDWETDHAGIKHYIPSKYLIGYEVQTVRFDRSHPTYWKLTLKKGKDPGR